MTARQTWDRLNGIARWWLDTQAPSISSVLQTEPDLHREYAGIIATFREVLATLETNVSNATHDNQISDAAKRLKESLALALRFDMNVLQRAQRAGIVTDIQQGELGRAWERFTDEVHESSENLTQAARDAARATGPALTTILGIGLGLVLVTFLVKK